MRRHRLDLLSLLFGVLFVLLGAAFLGGQVDVLAWNPRWGWPIAAFVLAFGVITGLLRSRGRGRSG